MLFSGAAIEPLGLRKPLNTRVISFLFQLLSLFLSSFFIVVVLPLLGFHRDDFVFFSSLTTTKDQIENLYSSCNVDRAFILDLASDSEVPKNLSRRILWSLFVLLQDLRSLLSDSRASTRDARRTRCFLLSYI